MDKETSIKKLQQQLTVISSLGSMRDRTSSPEFKKWNRDTETALRKIFGEDSRHVKEFKEIRYHLSAFSSRTTENERHDAYVRGLKSASAMLESMIREIEEYGLTDNDPIGLPKALPMIEILCQRFHRFARQLQHRYDSRQTIDIEDEYDLQDVFHALLRLHFDDVRPEEHTPSYAGGSSRVDFLLKNEKIVIELKKTRKSLKTKDIGEQLIIDIARYSVHNDCKCLVCFVYDPEGKISNPEGLEQDLERQSSDKLKVRVIISPKN